jgi:hypothetical protein
MPEYVRFWLVFTKTRVYKFGHWGGGGVAEWGGGGQIWRTNGNCYGQQFSLIRGGSSDGILAHNRPYGSGFKSLRFLLHQV